MRFDEYKNKREHNAFEQKLNTLFESIVDFDKYWLEEALPIILKSCYMSSENELMECLLENQKPKLPLADHQGKADYLLRRVRDRFQDSLNSTLKTFQDEAIKTNDRFKWQIAQMFHDKMLKNVDNWKVKATIKDNDPYRDRFKAARDKQPASPQPPANQFNAPGDKPPVQTLNQKWPEYYPPTPTSPSGKASLPRVPPMPPPGNQLNAPSDKPSLPTPNRENDDIFFDDFDDEISPPANIKPTPPLPKSDEEVWDVVRKRNTSGQKNIKPTPPLPKSDEEVWDAPGTAPEIDDLDYWYAGEDVPKPSETPENKPLFNQEPAPSKWQKYKDKAKAGLSRLFGKRKEEKPPSRYAQERADLAAGKNDLYDDYDEFG